MNELRLLFTAKAEDEYTIQLVPGWSGSAGGPIAFKPFLTDADHEDLRWYLEEFLDLPDGGSVVRAGRVETSLGQWGRKLYDAIFKDGDNRELLNQLEKEPAPRSSPIRTVGSNPARAGAPWS